MKLKNFKVILVILFCLFVGGYVICDRYSWIGMMLNTVLSRNTDVTAFIYKQPKDIELVSLSEYCPTGKLCQQVHDFTCLHDTRLCIKDDPAIKYLTFSDNSARATDYMLEAEKQTLVDNLITNVTRLPNIQKTEITIITGKKILYVGDQIQISLKLVDNSGQYLKRGGDDIRVWMIEKKKNMRIAGRVQDYNNGTYLVRIPTLWKGSNSVFIAIPYFREESATIFRWYRQFYTLYYHYARFSGKTSQITPCSVNSKLDGYKEVCDLSFYNGGDPWYCGKPTSPNLKCDDFTFTYMYRFKDIGVTNIEFNLFRRSCTHAGRELVLASDMKVRGIGGMETKLPNCRDLNTAKTWDLSVPTGYYNGTRYLPTTCHATKPDVASCLQSTTLIITGDSTSYQWFEELVRYSNASLLVPKKWPVGNKAQKMQEIICVQTNWNFTLKFLPHTMPYIGFHRPLHSQKPSTKSMLTILDEIPSTGRYIFIFHFYAHFELQHYNVFRNKLIGSLKSLRKALERNKDLQVVVKGPHIFYCIGWWIPTIQDFLGRHLISILLSEMKEFSARVLYLDLWDMTVSIKNTALHPTSSVVWNQIELLLDHVC